jgi:predicted dehydrogenase
MKKNRRAFLQQSSALAGGAFLLPGLGPARSLLSKVSPADQLNVGAIGLNGMGWADLSAALRIPGVNVVALCDIDRNVLDRRMKELAANHIDTSRIHTYSDYRKLLGQKDIDFVIIGTPDHWHAKIMIEACMAGKDVYVEKPVGNSIGECRAMVAAQKKYNRAVQAGQWQRSQQHFRDAVDFVYSGQLGRIRTVKVWCYQGWMKPGPVVPDSAPPPGVMTDWGVHLLDYGLLGMKAGVPKTIAALGGDFAYPDLYQETPDTLTTLYEFDGFNLVWDHAMGIDNGSYGRDHGIAYIGNNGTLVLSRGGWEVIEEKNSKTKVAKPFVKQSDDGLANHMANFIGVVRSRRMEDLHCPIQAGDHVATVAQMGNISFRSGKRLTWDAAAARFTDDAVNRQYLMKEYHNGYVLPKV